MRTHRLAWMWVRRRVCPSRAGEDTRGRLELCGERDRKVLWNILAGTPSRAVSGGRSGGTGMRPGEPSPVPEVSHGHSRFPHAPSDGALLDSPSPSILRRTPGAHRRCLSSGLLGPFQPEQVERKSGGSPGEVPGPGLAARVVGQVGQLGVCRRSRCGGPLGSQPQPPGTGRTYAT